MASSRLVIFFCSILLHLFAPTTTAQDTTAVNVCSPGQGNFTANSPYQANLNRLFSSLPSNTKIHSGFFNVSYGRDLDQVNAIGLCRGDVKPDGCRSCITTAALELPKVCPNQKEAVIWYDNCMLRYSNRWIFGNMEFGPWAWMYNLNNVSDPSSFNPAVRNLLDGLKVKAASGGSVRKFATGNANTPDSQTIYALVQCTPDLSKQSCVDCLNNATDLLPKCCDGRQGGRVLAPSCNFRYEVSLFYNVTADAPMTSPSPSPSPPLRPTLTPTPMPPAHPPASQGESPSPPPPSAPAPTGPPPSTAPPPAPLDQSPPPAPLDQSPPPLPPPPPPSNSANQKGKASHFTSATFVLVLVPLLLWKY